MIRAADVNPFPQALPETDRARLAQFWEVLVDAPVKVVVQAVAELTLAAVGILRVGQTVAVVVAPVTAIARTGRRFDPRFGGRCAA